MKLRNRLKQSCRAEQVSINQSNTPLHCEHTVDSHVSSPIEDFCGRMAPRSRDIFIRSRSATCLFALIALVAATSVLLSTCSLATAQYGSSGSGSSYSHYQQAGDGNGYASNGYDYSEMDERPKVNLGIRLRIPAFKFELPRFSLPKITVSAKIRQPEGPRVITLPEINLDTSSKVEPPNSGHAPSPQTVNSQYGSDYSSSATNYQRKPSSSYGAHTNQGSSQVFSFSTDEEKHAPSPSSNSYPSSPSRYYSQAAKPAQMTTNQYGHQRPHQATQQMYRMGGYQAAGGHYGAAKMSQASFSGYGRIHGTGSRANHYQHRNGVQASARALTSANYQGTSAGKNNADLGFNSPVYVDPHAMAAAGRYN